MKQSALRFTKPSLELIGSYIEALEEGSFTHMAVGGFGDAPAEDVRQNPQGHIRLLTDTSPRQITTPNGEVFTFHDHEIIWVTDPAGRFLGGISMRFDDNDLINRYCGHAGMSVRPSLLYKGYGVKMAKLLIPYIKQQAQKRGLKKLSASADPTNPASYKIIEHLGGQLKHESDPFGWGETRFYEWEV